MNTTLGQFPNAKAELLASMEADIYPRDRPDMSIQVDGAIGERSPFHEIFGYYAHGVSETTAILPAGWERRLVPIRNENTGGGTGWCLEVHDLAASKLAAGRDKDLDFVGILLNDGMINHATLTQLVDVMPLSSERKSIIRDRLKRICRLDGKNSSPGFS